MPIRGRYVSEMLEPGQMVWTAYPASAGVGQVMMHPADAAAALEAGRITINGLVASVKVTDPEWPSVLSVTFDDAPASWAFDPTPSDAAVWIGRRLRLAA